MGSQKELPTGRIERQGTRERWEEASTHPRKVEGLTFKEQAQYHPGQTEPCLERMEDRKDGPIHPSPSLLVKDSSQAFDCPGYIWVPAALVLMRLILVSSLLRSALTVACGGEMQVCQAPALSLPCFPSGLQAPFTMLAPGFYPSGWI